MSEAGNNVMAANEAVPKRRPLTAAAWLLGEDAAEIRNSSPIERQWLLTRAGLLLVASGLSASGYFLFARMAFTRAPPGVQFGFCFGVWLFIVLLDRGVSAIRHGGSGCLRTAAFGVRLMIAIAVTSITSLGLTTYFAEVQLQQRMDQAYQTRIAPLIGRRDAGLHDLAEVVRLKRDDLAAVMKLREDAVAAVHASAEQIREQQTLRDRAASDKATEVRTGKGPRYDDAETRRVAAEQSLAQLRDAQMRDQSNADALKVELDGRRSALDGFEAALAEKNAELTDAMRRDPAWSENVHDPFMVVSALLDLMEDPRSGATARRILAAFAAIILALEMSFIVLSVIAPAGEYDAKVRYRRNDRPRGDVAAEDPDRSPEPFRVAVLAPGWRLAGG
jgi:hypothetical protein